MIRYHPTWIHIIIFNINLYFEIPMASLCHLFHPSTQALVPIFSVSLSLNTPHNKLHFILQC